MHRHTLKLLVASATAAVGMGALLIWAARGPDFELRLEREVRTPVPPTQLQKAVGATINWPDWHFNTREVLAIDFTGFAYPARDQWVKKGSLLELSMEPPKKEWKRFLIRARVLDYVPGELLSVAFIEETKGRIQKLLSELTWTLRFEPLPADASGRPMTLIRGTATARTLSAKGRIFGRLAPKILMNQVFYPDLERLGRLEFPRDPAAPEEGRNR